MTLFKDIIKYFACKINHKTIKSIRNLSIKLSKIILYCCQIASRTPNLIQSSKIVKLQTLYRKGWADLWTLGNVLIALPWFKGVGNKQISHIFLKCWHEQIYLASPSCFCYCWDASSYPYLKRELVLKEWIGFSNAL